MKVIQQTCTPSNEAFFLSDEDLGANLTSGTSLPLNDLNIFSRLFRYISSINKGLFPYILYILHVFICSWGQIVVTIKMLKRQHFVCE